MGRGLLLLFLTGAAGAMPEHTHLHITTAFRPADRANGGLHRLWDRGCGVWVFPC